MIPHLEGLPDTNLFVSSDSYRSLSNFEVFEMTENPLRVRRLFSFGDSPGSKSFIRSRSLIRLVILDIATNKKRNFMGLLSVRNKTSYHLFDYANMQIAKKARWKVPHTSTLIPLKCVLIAIGFDR